MTTYTMSTDSVASGTIQQQDGSSVISVDALPIDDFLNGLSLDSSNALLHMTIDDS